MTHKNMMEILDWARNNNVMRLKCEEIEVEFAPAALEPTAPDMKLEELMRGVMQKEQTNSSQELTESEELLNYYN